MNLLQLLSRMPRRLKRLLMMVLDGLLLGIALRASVGLIFGWNMPVPEFFYWFATAVIVSTLLVLIQRGIYRAMLRYIGLGLLIDTAKSIGVGALVFLGLTPFITTYNWGQALSLVVVYVSLATVIVCLVRLCAYSALNIRNNARLVREPVVIYGAGEGGQQLAHALLQSPEFEPIAFLDDALQLQGHEVHGLRVFRPDRLKHLIPKYNITRVLLAMPSVSRNRQREIVESLEPLAIKLMIMPGLTELAEGRKRIGDIREIEIEDLLGREAIAPDRSLLSFCIESKVVMVTGAGGSIGAELCRQIISVRPHRLILLEITELALYSIERELLGQCQRSNISVEIIPILGSCQDFPRLKKIMTGWSVDTVYHAAAYKHVPLVEFNLIEGVRNNCFGTLQVARAAIAAGIKTFVLISTDKAVRPTNVMGASKRLAELVVQGLSAQSPGVHMCIVRFGNVLASSGSVVPLFREQIRNGDPVTVTHPEMLRYFMTIREAAQLVIQAGAMGEHGEVFVLDMGEPVLISNLARRMIHLSGLRVRDADCPDGDIEIVYTGIRPGEKLYEELLITDKDIPTKHPRILCAKEDFTPWVDLSCHLDELEQADAEGDLEFIRQKLEKLAHGYKRGAKVTDYGVSSCSADLTGSGAS